MDTRLNRIYDKLQITDSHDLVPRLSASDVTFLLILIEEARYIAQRYAAGPKTLLIPEHHTKKAQNFLKLLEEK